MIRTLAFALLISLSFFTQAAVNGINFSDDNIEYRTGLSGIELKALRKSYINASGKIVRAGLSSEVIWSHMVNIPHNSCFKNESILDNYSYYELLRISVKNEKRENQNHMVIPTYEEMFDKECFLTSKGQVWASLLKPVGRKE
jgi:hypothetical protein